MVLLFTGFSAAVRVGRCQHSIKLYKLAEGYGGSFGAAILGAKEAGLTLTVDYNRSKELFDTIKI